MSRRGVAAAVGKPESTIRGWVERGLAYPNEEPWGSFSEDYRRAERSLEGAAAGTTAWVVRELWRCTQLVDRGRRSDASDEERAEARDAADHLMANAQLKELLNVLAARFPEDWGTSKHRKPEPEHDAQAYLDANAMTHEQLTALLTDPPDTIRGALVSAAPAVYAILIAGGFDPARKATNEREEHAGDAAQAAGQDSGAVDPPGRAVDDQSQQAGGDAAAG